jgi:hypothetical protein
VDRHSVLVPLADIHHVGISELTGDEPGDPRASHDAAFRRFEQAMAFDALESVIGADDDVHAPDLARLWLDVEDPARPAGQMHPPSSYRLATRASAG